VQPVLITVVRNSLLLMGAMVFAFVLLKDNLGMLTAAVESYRDEQTQTPSPQHASRTQPAPAREYVSSDGGQMVIEGGDGGHFHLIAEIGGREIEFLVDTGASMVALSEEDAETIGLPIYQLDYTGQANTANGVARFAPVTIDEMAIGDHVVRNVQGAVIEGHSGNSLLGMTFLRKLSGFEVKDNRLFLRW
jgi:aspartyl protease family protein